MLGQLDRNSSRQIERGPTVGDPSVAKSLHTTAVVTPEAVLLEFRAAGIASRLLAKGIDLILQFIVLYVALIASIFVAAANETAAVISILVSTFLVLFGYPVIEAFWNGQTLGKKILGIKVITVEGGPAGFRHAAIRALVWIVEFLLPPGGLVALAAALFTRRSQRVGDLAAGTVVVRSATSKMTPFFFAPAYGAEQFSATFDAGRIGPQQYALIREFLSRAHELTPGARAHVGKVMSDALEAASGHQRPPEIHPEVFLVSAVFAVQQRFAPADSSPVPPPVASTAVRNPGVITRHPPSGPPPPPTTARPDRSIPPPAAGTRR